MSPPDLVPGSTRRCKTRIISTYGHNHMHNLPCYHSLFPICSMMPHFFCQVRLICRKGNCVMSEILSAVIWMAISHRLSDLLWYSGWWLRGIVREIPQELWESFRANGDEFCWFRKEEYQLISRLWSSGARNAIIKISSPIYVDRIVHYTAQLSFCEILRTMKFINNRNWWVFFCHMWCW